jgi:positive regulator of sigma E activity
MIEDIGRVVRVADDKAFIEVERSSACASCGLQKAEELAAGARGHVDCMEIEAVDVIVKGILR